MSTVEKDVLHGLWQATVRAGRGMDHLSFVKGSIEVCAVKTEARAECYDSRWVRTKMVIRTGWVVDAGLKVGEEGRMLVLIKHSGNHIHCSCSLDVL